MALTPSTMLPLGTPAPEFWLPDADGNIHTPSEFTDAAALLILFICNHCPYVKHIKEGLIKLANDYQPKGVGIIGINSNDPETHPEDAPDKMNAEAYPFPYLVDTEQNVAKAYCAACTPDIFLFNQSRELVYRGQFDSSRPGNGIPVSGKDLRGAIDAVLENRLVTDKQVPSIGCNIKWKPGNEPNY